GRSLAPAIRSPAVTPAHTTVTGRRGGASAGPSYNPAPSIGRRPTSRDRFAPPPAFRPRAGLPNPSRAAAAPPPESVPPSVPPPPARPPRPPRAPPPLPRAGGPRCAPAPPPPPAGPPFGECRGPAGRRSFPKADPAPARA